MTVPSLIVPLAARCLRTAMHAVRPLCARMPGAYRALILHDTAPHLSARLASLFDTLSARCAFISPEDAAGCAAEKRDAGKESLLLSFDDGFMSNHQFAIEVLEPRGIRAIFFVCPGLIDLPAGERERAVASNVHLGGVGRPTSLMTWREIEDLRHRGHTVGSHLFTHRRMTELPEEGREREVAMAAEALRSRLGMPAEWAAFPFGDIGSIDSASLKAIGKHHRYCRSGIRGLNSPLTPPLALFGEHVGPETPLDLQLLAAEGGLDFRYTAARRRLLAMAA